jgi:hypothetical protein
MTPESFQKRQAVHESSLPRFGGAHLPALLWGGVAFLVMVGVGLCRVESVPVIVPGYAALVGAGSAPAEADAKGKLLIFVQPELLPRLRIGQQVCVRGRTDGSCLRSRLVAVEPAVSTVAAAKEKYGLSACLPPQLPRKAATVLAEYETPGHEFPPEVSAEGLYRADIIIGERQAGTLLPLVGGLFSE